MKRKVLVNAKIYTDTGLLDPGYIVIAGEKIVEIGPLKNRKETPHEVVEDLHGLTIIPGMIDVHTHGLSGADVMDATPEAIETMAMELPKEGTTSFLATTMTQEERAIEDALENVAAYMGSENHPGKSEVLGIHLEGPFVNPKKAGAQPIEFMVSPSVKIFKKWNKMANQHIKLVTLAPELDAEYALIQYLHQTGVVASIGHSDATYEVVRGAVKSGLSHATHLYNGMRGLHHREPGVVGGVFLQDEILAEIIADGIHVDQDMVKLAFRQKGSDRMALITDSMRAKCLKNGSYDLGGQRVLVQDGRATLESNNSLAGSVLKMSKAAKNVLSFTQCTIEEIIKMTSTNVARELGFLDRKGSIAVGKDADLVVLDSQFDVIMTFCRGKLAYSKQHE